MVADNCVQISSSPMTNGGTSRRSKEPASKRTIWDSNGIGTPFALSVMYIRQNASESLNAHHSRGDGNAVLFALYSEWFLDYLEATEPR